MKSFPRLAESHTFNGVFCSESQTAAASFSSHPEVCSPETGTCIHPNERREKCVGASRGHLSPMDSPDLSLVLHLTDSSQLQFGALFLIKFPPY